MVSETIDRLGDEESRLSRESSERFGGNNSEGQRGTESNLSPEGEGTNKSTHGTSQYKSITEQQRADPSPTIKRRVTLLGKFVDMLLCKKPDPPMNETVKELAQQQQKLLELQREDLTLTHWISKEVQDIRKQMLSSPYPFMPPNEQRKEEV